MFFDVGVVFLCFAVALGWADERPGGEAWPAGEGGGFEGPLGDPYDAVLMRERERVMAAVIRAEEGAGEGGVCALVGEDHLPGLESLLSERDEAFNPFEPLATVADLLEDPPAPSDGELAGEAYAVKRGVLEGLLVQTSQSMVGVAEWALEPAAPEFEDVRGLVALIYGHHRMTLAACPPDLLAEVSGEREGTGFWQDLEAFRQARPVNGGGGYSDPVVDQIVAGAIEDLPSVVQGLRVSS